MESFAVGATSPSSSMSYSSALPSNSTLPLHRTASPYCKRGKLSVPRTVIEI